MNNSYRGIEFFIRIILVTTIMIQYLSMPLSAFASSESDDNQPLTARQQVAQLRQGDSETDEMYLERIGQSQPEMLQNAAMLSVQEALNGRIDENTTLEANIIQQIDQSIDEALADPAFGLNTDGGYDETGAYNWESRTFSPTGDVTGAWAMEANLGDDINPATFEAAFEEQLEARSAEIEQITPEQPTLITPDTNVPQPFDPFTSQQIEPIGSEALKEIQPQASTIAPVTQAETVVPEVLSSQELGQIQSHLVSQQEYLGEQPNENANVVLPTSQQLSSDAKVARETKQLENPLYESAANFANSVNVDGDTAVVSSPTAMHIFERNHGGANNWGLVSQLVTDDGVNAAVQADIDGDRVVASAANGSSVIIFERNQGGPNNWGEAGRFTPVVPSGFWGGSRNNDSWLSLDGDRVVVGSPYATTDIYQDQMGMAHVFERNQGGDNNWGLVAQLIPSSSAEYQQFGITVGLSDDTVVVGTNSKGAYIFERNQGGGNNWGQVVHLTTDVSFTGFGLAVDIDENTVAIGDMVADTYKGKVYVYERNQGGSNSWGKVTEISPVLGPEQGDNSTHFGEIVKLDGDRLFAGAWALTPQPNIYGGGGAFVFERNYGGTNNWGMLAKVTHANPERGHFFGRNVDISGDTLFVSRRTMSTSYYYDFAFVFDLVDGSMEVDTTVDSNDPAFQVCDDAIPNDCSLRGAISKVNYDKRNRYVIDVPAGTYTLSLTGIDEEANATGDLDVTGGFTLIGAGAATVIDANNIDRIFDVKLGGYLGLQNVTLSNGRAFNGGAIHNAGTVEISEVTFSGNAAGNYGGGVYNEGTLNLARSTFVGNTAHSLGGGAAHLGGTLTVENSTFSANVVGTSADFGWGGGLLIGAPSATIHNSTFADNQALGNGDDILVQPSGNVAVDHSILASTHKTTCYVDAGGVLTSAGYNIDQANTCGFAATGDQINTNPVLGELANHGGQTNTFILRGNSPAVERGNSSCAVTIDQRGITRPSGSQCDIGAYEYVAPACPAGGVLYVKPDGAGAKDGTSWENAFAFLVDALTTTSVCEVRVAGGVYTPGPSSSSSFLIGPNVRVYGGYAGDGDNPDQRDLVAHPTVLSGDIGGDDLNKDSNGVTTHADNIQGTNSNHVVVIRDVGTDVVLDGFTITGGDTTLVGGGILCDGTDGKTCSPTLRNLRIIGNRAQANQGGGLAIDASQGTGSPYMELVTFENNSANQGGGIWAQAGGGNSHPTLLNSTFKGNKSASHGAGMRVEAGNDGQSNPTLTGVTFVGNEAGGHGGGFFSFAYSGGETAPTLTNVHFIGNHADSAGGGFGSEASVDDENNLSINSPTLRQVVFNGNTATEGGAILHQTYGGVMDNSPSIMTIVNGVIVNSQSTAKGGAIVNGAGGQGNLNIHNTIFANNQSNGDGNQIFSQLNGNTTLTHSLVPSKGVTDFHIASGTIDTSATTLLEGDPLFTDVNGADDVAGNGDDDFRLLPGSPAIDSGASSYLNNTNVTLDLDGNPRITGPEVDMGVYEFTQWVSIPGLDNAVHDLATNSSGTIYAAGAFSNYVASFDGTSWTTLDGLDAAAHVAHIAEDGTLYVGGAFTEGVAHWTGSAWQATGSGLPTGIVQALARSADGTLYAAGDSGVYALSGNTWQKLGSLSSVRALAVYNGTLYAGGSFNSGYLARWDGSTWQGVVDANNPNGLDAPVNALIPYAGHLAVGGEFTATGNGILFWDGQRYSRINGVTILTNDAKVTDFDVIGSLLAIVGDFDSADGNDGFDLAVWNGSQFVASLGGLYEQNNHLETVVMTGGDLYVGGSFAKVGGRSTTNVGFLDLETTDLNVTLTTASQLVWPGTLDLTMSVGNQANEVTEGVALGVWLPPNATLASNGGSCTANEQLVRCVLGNMQPSASQQVTMTLNVANDSQNPAIISAFVGNEKKFDATPIDNIARQQVDLVISPDRLVDLGIAISTDVTQVAFQDIVTYSVAISNTGTGAGRDVLATITLPSGGVYQSATHANCTLDTNKVLCDLDQIDPNATSNFDISVQMNGNGAVTAAATVADQSTNPTTSDSNTANNSATSREVIVLSESRAFRQIGNVVVAANSFEVADGKVKATGAIEMGTLDDNDNPVYTVKLTAGLDYVEWLETVEAGEDPPEGEPAIKGRGLVTIIGHGNSLYIGDFQIDDADNPTVAAGEDLIAQIDEIESFTTTGTITYTGITLQDGVATLEASIAISPRGISTTAQLTGQMLASGDFSGTIDSLAFTLSSLEISAENITIADDALTVATITITLSENLGGAVGTATDLRITSTSISIGDIGAEIPLPDINIGDGSTIKLTNLKATIGYFGGAYSLKVAGTLNLTLPDNAQEIDLSFSINSNGEIEGSVSGFSLNVAGAELKLEEIGFNNSGLTIDVATLTLPDSFNGAKAVVKNVKIDENGLSFGGASVTIPLPDIKIGEHAVIHNLIATLEVDSDSSRSLSFAFAVEGKARILVPNNAQTVKFTAKLKGGSFTGTVDKISITMFNSTLVMESMAFKDGVFTVAEAKLTLPAVLQNSVITLTDVKISKNGLEIGGGSLEVPLPDTAIGGESSAVQLTLTNASLIIAKTSDSFSLTLKGKVRIAISGNSAEATGRLSIDWNGNLSGEVESFKIEVVGMEFRVEQVTMRDGVLQAKLAGITLPEAFGGLSAEVYDLRIGNGEFEISGGSFKLPEIRVASFILSVEGRLQREGSQYIITASGTFAMANLPTAGPGCSGIGVSLTVYVNTNREMVMEIAPIDPSTPELDQARAGASSIGLRNVTVQAYCRIPIASTGFSLTRIFGSLTLNSGTTRIELGVTIETDFQLLGAPALRSSPTLGVESGPGYFQVDFNAAVEVFAMFQAARLDAKMRLGQKHPGDPDSYISATLWVDVGIIQGSTSITAWTQNGSFHLVGHGHISLNFEKGFIFEKCVDTWLFGTACLSIPPFGVSIGFGAAFGEFRHGSGTAWGVKGYAEYWGYQIGVYVNSRGSVDFGNVTNYHTITPPDLSRAAQLHRDINSGRLARAALSAEDVAIFNTYRFTNDATLIDMPVSDGDILLNFLHSAPDEDVLEVRLIRPDGLEIGLDNLPANVVSLRHISETNSSIALVQKTIVVDEPMHGLWQVKLIGTEQATQPYILDVKGSVSGPTLSEVTQTQVDDTHIDVTWGVSSKVPTTTVNIYATAGPITTTQTITPDGGVAQEEVIDLFSGAAVLENVSTTLDGTSQTARIDFTNWESGEYYVWVDANDSLNPPSREYAPGKIIVEHPWSRSWTASTVMTPTYRTLDLSWVEHTSHDVDTYHIYLTPDGENFLSEDARVVEVGDATSTVIDGLRANTEYAVKVVAVDLDTDRKSESEISTVTVAGAPFSIAANPAQLTLSSGESATVQLTLTADADPFPAIVVLSEESESADIVTTVQTEVVTPTVAGVTSDVTILASPLLATGQHTVTVRASAAGDVRYIDIPVMVQAPTFALRSSEDTLTLTENGTATVEIDATYLYGEDDDIILTLNSLPNGLDARFDTQAFGVGEKVTLTITDTNLLTNGTYTLTVTGNDDDGNEKRLDLALVVDKPTFSLSSVEGTDAQAAHNSMVRYTVALDGDGWDSPVSISIDESSLSGYLTPTIQLPARVLLTPPATFDVVVDVADAASVPAAVYEMVLVASSNGVIETLPLQLAVGAENAQPDLRVTSKLSANEVNAGELVTVITRYENRGAAAFNSDAGDGVSHNRIMTGTQPLLIPVTIDGCDTLVEGTDTNGFDGTYRCDAYGTLEPGDVFTRTTVYRVYEGAADGAMAYLSETVNVPNEFDTKDNKWRAKITVRNTSDVTVDLNASTATQNAGERVTYTATVKTNGNADATGATVTFTPSALLRVQNSSESCVVVDGQIVCEVGMIASGCGRATASSAFTCDAGSATTQTVSVTVQIAPAATVNQTMGVVVDGTLADSDGSNNDDSVTVAVTTLSALRPNLTTTVAESNEGGTHSHTLVVTNDGPSVARNVTISYTLPAAASYATLQVNGNRADKNKPQIVSGLTLAPGKSVTVKLDIKHMQDTAGAFADSVIAVSANGETTQEVTLSRKVHNIAPTVALVNSVVSVPEGGRIQLTAVASDTNPLDETSPAWSVDWDLDSDGDYDDGSGNVVVLDATNIDGEVVERRAANTQVSVQVTDGVDSSQANQTFTVLNVAPTVKAGKDQRAPVIQPFTLNATFTDPAAADTHTAVVQWGDGTQETVTVNNKTVSASHTYDAIGTYNAQVCVTDDDGGVGCDVVQMQASCLEHGLVADNLTYYFDNQKLVATADVNYLGTLLPTPLPEEVSLTLYNGETAIDTITVRDAFAQNFSQGIQFEWDMAPLDTYTLTVALDDDGAGNNPLSLCVSGRQKVQADTGTVTQNAPEVGESTIYGPTGVTIGRTGGDDPGMITVKKSVEPIADADYLDAMWSITADDEEGLEIDLKVCYADGDLSAEQAADEANLILYHRHEPTDNWEALVSTADPDANCVTAQVTQFSDFLIGLANANAIALESFTATATEDETVVLEWVTSAEFDHAGFNVYRTATDTFTNNGALNAQILPSGGVQGQGGSYSFEDATVESGDWFYWLEDVDIYGERTLHGPVELTVAVPTAVTVRGMASTSYPVGLLLTFQVALVGLTLLVVRQSRRRRRRN